MICVMLPPCRFQVGNHFAFDVLSRFRPFLALQRPFASGMERIPAWAQSGITAFAGVVVAEAVDQVVPQWAELRDYQRLTKGDPNVIDHEVAAREILDAEILRCTYSVRMFLLPLVQHLAGIIVQADLPFSRTGRNGLANVDRYLALLLY